MRTRTPAMVYRSRSIDDWCDAVRRLDVHSLTEWAVKSHSSYHHALALGVQRTVATALGWESRLPNGGPAELSDQEFAQRFIARGARTAGDLWRINNAWCRQLSRQGRLDHVRSLVHAPYVTERHEPAAAYFIERCRRYDFFEAWTCVDRVAAMTARRLGFLEQVRAVTPHRPPRFKTRGGPV